MVFRVVELPSIGLARPWMFENLGISHMAFAGYASMPLLDLEFKTLFYNRILPYLTTAVLRIANDIHYLE